MKRSLKWVLFATSLSSLVLASGIVIGSTNIIRLPGNSTNNGHGDGNNNGGEDNKPNEFVKPQLKSSIKGIGSLDKFITTSSKADDVNKNFNNVINGNKEQIISNWTDIPEDQQKLININSKVKNWDNNAWGSKTFSEWSSKNQPTTMVWKGFGESPNTNEKIDFKSNSGLKDFFDTNLDKIAKNSLENFDNKKASLANSDIAIGDNGELLVGVLVSDNQQPATIKKFNSETTDESVKNYVLSIPADNVNFLPELSIETTYGADDNNLTLSSDVSFVYTVTSNETKEHVFSSKATSKKVIILDEKSNDNNSIGLITSPIKDIDILKSLKWVTDGKELTDHVDGNEIDATELNEDQIINDLEITNLTKDRLLGIQIEMKTRDINSADFNGEYSILIFTTLSQQSNNDIDLNLNFTTYKIVSELPTEEKKSSVPLQLNVPNAYYVDKIGESNIFLGLRNEKMANYYLESALTFGSKGHETNEDNYFAAFKQNFTSVNSERFKELLIKIDANKENNIKLFGYIEFTGISVTGDADNLSLEITIQPKKGFTFKKAFNITENEKNITYNQNSESRKLIISGSITATAASGEKMYRGFLASNTYEPTQQISLNLEKA
ncbi:hypothetical protein [Malacoplasma iowae]|uniref:hypothetical protein n=1 Tax=Malacoplasma iowae TaxID=2116 RepID=UPI002A186B2A|nr:hypothetical protein [Malacoplasma iowae]WPL39420.1 hypothetical protein QX183_02620 [Malacoplasma iowae]